MKNKKQIGIPLTKVLNDIYNEDPTAQARIEARVEQILLKIHLREARKKAKLSQAQLAKKSGVRQDKISKIENGQQNFTIGTLHKIAAALDKKVRIELE